MIRRLLPVALSVVLLVISAGSAAALEGRLVLDVNQAEVELVIVSDRYQMALQPGLKLNQLPVFDFEFVTDDGALIPVVQGPVASEHPVWEYVVGVGRIGIAESGAQLISLPVSLQQRNQNCIHNGLLQLRIDAAGRAARASYDVRSETCIDLKLDLSTTVAAHYRPAPVLTRAQLIARYRANRQQRLPVRPLEDLVRLGVDLDNLSAAGVIPAADMTTLGLLLDGVHYRGGCQTRAGDYSLCDELPLPSYSLAKSFFAGLGLMRLEQLYPGAADAVIADFVPECAGSDKWQDVRFKDALNMVTGVYDSPGNHVDEGAAKLGDGFFAVETHAGRIAYACNTYPKRQPAGQRWVYNTSTTYVLGVAMDNFLRAQGGGQDLYDDVLLAWWKPLALSPALDVIRRTYDERGQALTGYGMTWLADDLLRLAAYVNGRAILQQVDQDLLSAALQRVPQDRGYSAGSNRYHSGFWGKDVTGLLGCQEQTWIPFLSGYGGLNVALLPNGIVYYYVSDAGRFSLDAGLSEIHKIRPVCVGA